MNTFFIIMSKKAKDVLIPEVILSEDVAIKSPDQLNTENRRLSNLRKYFKKLLLTTACLMTITAPNNEVNATDALKIDHYYPHGLNSLKNDPRATAYNPAGITQGNMPDGFSLSTDITPIFLTVENKNQKTGEVLKSDTVNPIPHIILTHRQGNRAFFGSINVPGAAGSVNFPKGSGTTQENAQTLEAFGLPTQPQSLEATSRYIALTLGMAQKVNDYLSISGSVRALQADKTVDAKVGEVGVKYDESARGLAPIVNAYLQYQQWGLGLNYKFGIPLNFHRTVHESLMPIAEKERNDLDGEISAGLSYEFPDNITGRLNWSYFLDSQAKRPAIANIPTHNAKEATLSVEKDFGDWLASVGLYWFDAGYQQQPTHETPKLDCWGAGALVKKRINENWEVTGSIAGYDYQDGRKNDFINSQKVWHAGIGVTRYWNKQPKRP